MAARMSAAARSGATSPSATITPVFTCSSWGADSVQSALWHTLGAVNASGNANSSSSAPTTRSRRFPARDNALHICANRCFSTLLFIVSSFSERYGCDHEQVDPRSRAQPCRGEPCVCLPVRQPSHHRRRSPLQGRRLLWRPDGSPEHHLGT